MRGSFRFVAHIKDASETHIEIDSDAFVVLRVPQLHREVRGALGLDGENPEVMHGRPGEQPTRGAARARDVWAVSCPTWRGRLREGENTSKSLCFVPHEQIRSTLRFKKGPWNI